MHTLKAKQAYPNGRLAKLWWHAVPYLSRAFTQVTLAETIDGLKEDSGFLQKLDIAVHALDALVCLTCDTAVWRACLDLLCVRGWMACVMSQLASITFLSALGSMCKSEQKDFACIADTIAYKAILYCQLSNYDLNICKMWFGWVASSACQQMCLSLQ